MFLAFLKLFWPPTRPMMTFLLYKCWKNLLTFLDYLPTSSCQHSLWMPCYLEVLTSLGSWNFWKIICIKKFCILHYCRYLDEVLLLKPLFLLQNSCDSNNTVFQYQPSKAFSPSDWAINGKSYSNILIWCLTVWWPHDISFASKVDIEDN